jgi:3-hydroxyisobutyrate dehydrogenase-like beta-hydroxyacid dehydrogenase
MSHDVLVARLAQAANMVALFERNWSAGAMDVGFIGVGRMGRVMAHNLLQAGHRVRAWDASPDAVREVGAHGAEQANSAEDAFRGDAVISMLPNDDAMRAVFLDSGILQTNGSSPIHVNMATASVQCADELAAAHAKAGIRYVSAPVFGRPEMAAERNLNILAAGDSDAIDRVQPLFDAMGRKTWRMGDVPSQSNLAKIAGNLMVACMLEAMGETAALARAYKMEPAHVLNVVVSSIFDVPVYRIYARLIGSGQYEPPGFDMRLGLKDAKLALEAGEHANVPLPFASVLRDNYLDALAHGDGGKDWSAVARVALRRAGLE